MPKQHILVIEDESCLRTLVCDILESRGYACLQAKDGREGIKLATEKFPDLIISDILMPYKDGHEVLQALQENPTTCNIPFIFLSVKNAHKDIRQGMGVGADDYLTKPFKNTDLLNAVAARLNKRKVILEQQRTELQKIRMEFTKTTHYDQLTGLPNQYQLQKLYGELTKKGTEDFSIVLLMISLDRFGFIQEVLGHRGRDEIIKNIATRLQRCLGANSLLFYTETNSFIILNSRSGKKEDIEALLRKIQTRVHEVIEYQDHKLYITTSIGCSYHVAGYGDLASVLDEAEVARYFIQNRGGNGYYFYNPEIAQQAIDNFELESGLFNAEENGELRAFYQPQIEIVTGRIVGIEALIRWQHPKFGLVPPLSFISIAEENGMIIKIGEWILREACSRVKEWRKICAYPVRVSVNISVEQFKSGDLPAIVERVLKETGVSSDCLELEVTESIFAKDMEIIVKQLEQLNALGLNIAIDDFGTGYSSLGYLKQLPIQMLKIDRSFIRDITMSDTAKELTATIVKMAKTLHLKVLAEGVETQEQLECIKEFGVQEYQGYLFSKPVPEKDFLKLLKNQKDR